MTALHTITGVTFIIIGSLLILRTLFKVKDFATNPRRGWLLAIVGGLFILGGCFLLIRADYSYDWLGLDDNTDAQGQFHRGKTLWDWLDLLIIPAMLALGGLWFNRQERKAEREIQEKRDKTEREIQDRRDEIEREIQDRRDQTEHKVAQERLREAALQMYLDRMTELLLQQRLRTSKKEDEVRDIAQARTLTVLRGLDGTRKGMLIQFLYKSDMIQGEAIVDLENADLTKTNLNGADLSQINLSRANLSDAKLNKTDLSNAILSESILSRASLNDAILNEAILGEAILAEADLRDARLRGVDLKDADLREAKLNRASLFGAKLHRADLTEAVLTESDLRNANLNEAILSNRLKTISRFSKGRML